MASSRRVLFVVNAFESDAPTRVTIELARGLKANRWMVGFVAWSRGGPLQLELSEEFPFAINLRQQSAIECLRPLALANVILKFRPAIVHSVLSRPAIGVMLSRAFTGRDRYCWVAGDHGIHEWQEHGRLAEVVARYAVPACLNNADLSVTVSTFAAHALAGAGVNSERIAVVPNGVDPHKYYPRTRAGRCSFLANTFPDFDPAMVWPLIGSAGNLREIKGHSDLVAALPGVRRTYPGAHLILWGDGPELARLRSLAHQHGVEDAVAFAGRVTNLESLLPLLDVFVQPSRVESFGLAAAEAMACGVPTIVANVGGLTEIAKQGNAARIFRSGDPDDLARVILSLLYNKQQLRRQGAAGRGRVLSQFTTTRMVQKMEHLYLELINPSESRGGEP